MRAIVWIVEETWKATARAARTLLPADTEITLLHVRATDAETVARGARLSLLGRPRHATDDSLDAISETAAQELLAEAQAVLGRDATLDARSGRTGREVVAAAEGADLLALARDAERANRGPRTLGPTARYVVDHAPCAVLLIWPDEHATKSKEKQ